MPCLHWTRSSRPKWWARPTSPAFSIGALAICKSTPPRRSKSCLRSASSWRKRPGSPTARMRSGPFMSDVADMLTMTATVRRETRAANTLGAFGVATVADHITGLACAIQPLSGKDELRFGRSMPDATHKMYVEGAPDILPRDTVVVTAGDVYWTGSPAFEVIGPLMGQGGLIEMSMVPLRRHVEN